MAQASTLVCGVRFATGRMWCLWTIVGMLAGVAQAFTSAPIQWSAVSGRNFIVAPGRAGPMEFPSKLTIRDASGTKTPDEIPLFTAKPDNTISWESPQGHVCLEAIGDESGVAVGVNQCDGGKQQLWSIVPVGLGSRIQLKGTNQCIDVNVYEKYGFNRGLDGAPMELSECNDYKTESWKFEAPFVLPTTEHPQAFYLHSVMTSFFSLVAVGALSLGAWIWRWQPKAGMVATNPGGMSLDSEGGLALTAPKAAGPMSRTGHVFMSASKEQSFLEFEPYYDQSTMPTNTYKADAPFTGKVRSVEKMVGPNAMGETYNIVIDHEGKMPYIEGQFCTLSPPGDDPETGKPHKPSFMSIASSRYGDDMEGTSMTLCVKRPWDPEDPTKKHFLCDAKPGDTLAMTGPMKGPLLLPESSPEADIIMVATGTGIAPYRGFIRRMFLEKTPYSKDFKGLAWLFLGVANTDSLLYDEEWKKIQKENTDRFRYDVALSSEQKNKDGGEMFIQDKVGEYADEVFDRLDKGAHIYFSGFKGMMPGMQDMLKKVAEGKGLDYEAFISDLKSKGQWHELVY